MEASQPAYPGWMKLARPRLEKYSVYMSSPYEISNSGKTEVEEYIWNRPQNTTTCMNKNEEKEKYCRLKILIIILFEHV